MGGLVTATPTLEELSVAVTSLVSDFNRQLSSLNDEHDRLAAVLDQMTDGLLIADAAGKVQFPTRPRGAYLPAQIPWAAA